MPFIELTDRSDATKLFVNPLHIAAVWIRNNGVWVALAGGPATIEVSESLPVILAKIAEAKE